MSMMTMGAAAWRGADSPPPGPPVLDTSMLSGRTYIFSASESPIYKGGSTSDGLATQDQDYAGRLDGLAGPATIRTFYDYYNHQLGELRANTFGPGLPSINIPGEVSMYGMTRPTGANLPTVFNTSSNYFGANAKTFIFAGSIHDCLPDFGAAWNNSLLFGDGSGYLGAHCYKSGSNAVLQWYSFSNDAYFVEGSVPLGVPFVLACRHSGGVLSLSINNGAWQTLGSTGSTSMMSGNVLLQREADVDTAVIVTCNSSNTDSNIAACCASAGKLVGLAI